MWSRGQVLDAAVGRAPGAEVELVLVVVGQEGEGLGQGVADGWAVPQVGPADRDLEPEAAAPAVVGGVARAPGQGLVGGVHVRGQVQEVGGGRREPGHQLGGVPVDPDVDVPGAVAQGQGERG